MSLGFHHAYKAGISFGKDDMLVPDTKKKIIADTEALVLDYEQQYNDGLITQMEKYNKVVDTWAKCTDRIAKEMMDRISAVEHDKETGREKPINSVYMMAHSGARGSEKQMRQLAGMRGLMAKPSGEIIETPIISNFKEGLSVLEYFNSTHGARKGLADTALKTANSGYLTRRLVDVAQDCIITAEDCGTDKGIKLGAVIDSGEVLVSVGDRVLGRVPADDVIHPSTGKVVVAAGELIDEAQARAIEEAQVQEVRIRSALTCELKNGICGKCYGRDLARGTPVNIGEAVGVIAAQSIGEPGTQLTMRTFHIGGTAQVADNSFVESNFAGKVKIRNRTRRARQPGTARGHGPQHGRPGPRRRWPRARRRTRSRKALTSRWTTAIRSSAASVWRNGTRTAARSSPRSMAWSSSRTCWKASPSTSSPTRRPASPTA